MDMNYELVIDKHAESVVMWQGQNGQFLQGDRAQIQPKVYGDCFGKEMLDLGSDGMGLARQVIKSAEMVE